MTVHGSVQMAGITKQFPGVLALDHVDLTLHPGEVHSLVGENGAGKSTLMNILFGFHVPDEGSIVIDGSPVTIDSPSAAIAMGIGMVHQHFKLVRPFTVTENIILGLEGRGPMVDLREGSRRVAAVAEQYAIDIDPDARIDDLVQNEHAAHQQGQGHCKCQRIVRRGTGIRTCITAQGREIARAINRPDREEQRRAQDEQVIENARCLSHPAGKKRRIVPVTRCALFGLKAVFHANPS